MLFIFILVGGGNEERDVTIGGKFVPQYERSHTNGNTVKIDCGPVPNTHSK